MGVITKRTPYGLEPRNPTKKLACVLFRPNNISRSCFHNFQGWTPPRLNQPILLSSPELNDNGRILYMNNKALIFIIPWTVKISYSLKQFLYTPEVSIFIAVVVCDKVKEAYARKRKMVQLDIVYIGIRHLQLFKITKFENVYKIVHQSRKWNNLHRKLK